MFVSLFVDRGGCFYVGVLACVLEGRAGAAWAHACGRGTIGLTYCFICRTRAASNSTTTPRYLLEPAVWPHALVGLVTFATMFGVLTELPGALSHAPYSLSAGLLGVSQSFMAHMRGAWVVGDQG